MVYTILVSELYNIVVSEVYYNMVSEVYYGSECLGLSCPKVYNIVGEVYHGPLEKEVKYATQPYNILG